jgi:TolA-binding protein
MDAPPPPSPPREPRPTFKKYKPLDERLAELHNEAVILQTELLLRQAQLLSGPEAGEEARQQAAALWQEARDLLLQVHQDGRQSRESAYLLGAIFQALDDLPAARDQFLDTASRYFGTPEGLAAELRAAHVLRILKEYDRALDSLTRVLEVVKDSSRFHNSRITLEDIRGEARDALSLSMEERRYPHAAALSEKLFPVFSAPLAKLRQAEVQAAWADHLERQAEQQAYSQALTTRQASHERFRMAGDLFAELAQLRYLTREYSDDVWRSAENYLRGKDYQRTQQQVLEYLKQEPRRQRPRALTMLGEAQLGLGQFPAALETFQACLGSYPKDPDTYRARIRAAQTHNELGQLDAATQLLLENLHNVSLAPKSIDWQDTLFLLAYTLQRQGIEAVTRAADARTAPGENEAVPRRTQELDSAAQLLDEAILRFRIFLNRYANDPRSSQSRYLLAEAYRYQAKIPQWKLPWEKIATRRVDLAGNMRQSLENAYQLYDQLTGDLNKKQDTSELTPMEQAIQRNCYFARAHTLFDMERYKEALDAYSTATSRYQKEPASLEAYQQIAACYRKLGDPAKALGAVEHARMVIDNMPTDVDYRKTTRFPRDVWLNLLK